MGVHHASLRAKTAHWPIWLLFAAWICANSPQAVTYDLIVWVHGARHFSHQQRLKADVAFILGGKKMALAVQLEKAAPSKPFAPPIAAEAVLKKIDLYAPFVIEWIPPCVGDLKVFAKADRAPDRARSEPLLPPPRGQATV
jgi:hypothetical protein